MANFCVLRFLQYLFAAFVCGNFFIAASASNYSGKCANGAPAREERYCRFFVKFDRDNHDPLDVRIKDALGVNNASETRSIGLIIAIDKYPKMQGFDISAAAVDRDRLVKFLTEDQKFDEVIVLGNEDASVDNIKYFLEDYLYYRASDFNKKARLLVAYSGHGRYGDADNLADANAVTARAAFVLSAADNPNGWVGVYKMQDFAGEIENLAPRYFHVLTLINTCFGGNFFLNHSGGGNPDIFKKPGSYAITAGTSNDQVLSLDPKRGSLFFDLLIEGIARGSADPFYWDAYRAVTGDGKTAISHGVVRTGMLHSFLTSSYAKIVLERTRNFPDFKLSDPWIGVAQAGIAWGGFFFLSDRNGEAPPLFAAADHYGNLVWKPRDSATFGKVSPTSGRISGREAPEISIPAGPVSSIAGRPDIKIFKAPDIYPVKGYDFSSMDGAINWTAFAGMERPNFIYVRAVGWSGVDLTFSDRWMHIKKLGIDHGFYLKYDFCRSPASQMDRLTSIVHADQESLPAAIEIVDPQGEDKAQLNCLKFTGLQSAKSGILHLASALRKYYGKTPLLYGNRNNLGKFLDRRSDEYMIWLGSWGRDGTQLRGRNPWTLWQYSGTLNVKGVGPKTTGNVFFGTLEQYKMFKEGKSNVAFKAVNE
jgi:lysozyme